MTVLLLVNLGLGGSGATAVFKPAWASQANTAIGMLVEPK